MLVRPRRLPTLLLAAALAAGCQARPGAAPAAPTKVRASATASPKPATRPVVDLAGPASPLKPGPATTAALTGKVKLPEAIVRAAGGIVSNGGASLVGDHGGGMISDHGGGLIGDHGGGLFGRPGALKLLQAEAALPVAGATVVLVDATGRPLTGPDGKPWTATTDAQGAFAFQGALPAANLLAAVNLGPAGLALAHVVRGRSGELALDVVSSYTAVYVLDRYVAAQGGDRQQTLDRLTDEAEAGTRAATAKALGGAAVASDALTTGRVVAAVDALRKRDRDLDDQLERVRKLLLVAGQADGGNGQLATEVYFGHFSDVAFGPDGRTYFAASYENRVYAIQDGRLVAIAGSGAPGRDQPAPDGTPALAAALDGVSFLRFDAQGRLHFQDARGRAYRLGTDGKLALLHAPPACTPLGLVDGPDGTIRAATQALYVGQPPLDADGVPTRPDLRCELVALGAPGAAKVVATWETPEAARLVREPGGGLWLVQRGEYYDFAVRSFDPATGALGEPQGSGNLYDQEGNLYREDEASVAIVSPGGQETTRAIAYSDVVPSNHSLGVFKAPNGDLVLHNSTRLHLVRGAAITPLAGGANGLSQPAAGSGDDLALGISSPSGLGVDAAGGLYVADVGNERLYTYLPGQAARWVSCGFFPNTLAVGRDGTAYMGDSEARIVKLAPGAKAFVPHHASVDYVQNLGVAPDGSLLAITFPKEADGGDARRFFERVDAAGKLLTRVAAPPMAQYVATDSQGTVFVMDPWGTDIWRLQADGTFARVGTFKVPGIGTFGPYTDGDLLSFQGFAVDPQGRLYATGVSDGTPDGKAEGEDPTKYVYRVARLDPATGKVEAIAGAGTRHLAGGSLAETLGNATGLAVSPAGDLYIADADSRTVRKIPAPDL